MHHCNIKLHVLKLQIGRETQTTEIIEIALENTHRHKDKSHTCVFTSHKEFTKFWLAGLCACTCMNACACVRVCVYWLLFLRERAELIQGSDWTILQEGMVLSSTDDDEVITMEMLCNCLIQQESGVNQKTVKYVEFVRFQLTVHGFFLIPEFTSNIYIQMMRNGGRQTERSKGTVLPGLLLFKILFWHFFLRQPTGVQVAWLIKIKI